jgi:tripartite-type tricarboxylate transporter receptor subunit TctC
MTDNLAHFVGARRLVITVMMGLCVLAPLFGENLAHGQASFYQGKTIRLIVGFTPGGLYDQYARILSRFMRKHIPGNPEIIVQNMPGAGSLVASNYIYGVAKPDGLTLGMVSSGVYLDQLLGKREVTYDVRKFVWIGSIDKRDLLLFVRADSPWKSIEDLLTTTEAPKCGASGTTDNTTLVGTVLEEAFGVKLQVVRGYPGASEIDLAIGKGELNCRGTGLTTHFSREPNLTWHKEGFDRHIIQTGVRRDPRLPDTPTLHEYMDKKKTPEISRNVARVMLLAGTLGRPMLATPGIPVDRVKILREAYLKAFREPEVIAEAKQRRLDLDVLSGDELEVSMRDAINQPREVVERVKKLIEANP